MTLAGPLKKLFTCKEHKKDLPKYSLRMSTEIKLQCSLNAPEEVEENKLKITELLFKHFKLKILDFPKF